MTTPTFGYGLFGLSVQSEIELPELSPLEVPQTPDVYLRLGTLDAVFSRTPGLHRTPDGVLLVIDEVGGFLAQGGRDILIEPAPAVPARNLRLFLLGSVMGLLLHQRGLLPLHANAVVIDGAAYAFTGPSGSGKSTLAAWFQDKGFRLLSDDVCVIDFAPDGTAIAWPGLPRLRLWRDALERSGRQAADYQRSYEEASDEWEKYDVPAQPRGLVETSCPLAGVFLLARADHAGIEELSKADALSTLFGNIYRGEYLLEGAIDLAWRRCLRLATQIPVRRWSRPWDVGRLDADVGSLLATISSRSAR